MTIDKNISNFISVTTGQVVALLCQLIIIKILTNQLSNSDFGHYSLIIIVPSLILPLIFCEFATALNRYFFEEDKYKLYFNCVTFLFFTFTALITACFLSFPIIKTLLTKINIEMSSSIFFLALTSHFFIYLGSLNLSFFKINFQPKWYLIHNLLAHGLKVVALLVFIKKLDLKLIFLIFALCHLTAFLISSTPLIIRSKFNFDFQLIKKAFNFSAWLIPSSYFGIIINSSDRFIIKLFMGLSQVGVYAIGYKIGDLVRQFFITSFSAILSPVKFNTQLDDKAYSSKMNLLFEAYIFAGLFICLGINSLSKPLILLLSNSSYLDAVYVIPLILTAHIIWGANDFLNSGYLLKNKTKITSLILLLGALVNLTLNFALIPKFGLFGACLSTALAYALSLPISYLCSIKAHFLRFHCKKIVPLFFIFLLLLSLQTFINLLDQNLVSIVIYNLSLSILFAIILYKTLNTNIKLKLTHLVKARFSK